MNTPHFPFLPTALRVEQSTAQEINARIERQTALHVERIAAGGPAAIEQRLVELDREWDIEKHWRDVKIIQLWMGGKQLCQMEAARYFFNCTSI